ncbi:hypothetical protein [Massilia sp. BSC265]|uniref:hypothetical protein n=1 Tax=Massilia sp. BSC265 TaxID=1549812 RepID=UPI0004E8E927|nr:hypothetical protein [Massilia sp. BSC265]KFI07047.1 hypothetical protein JN27_12305 [Massilia sp. BSC265]
MDRTRSIDGLGAVLRDAGARADWELLGRAVGELAPRLQALAGGRPWTDAERAALERLRSAHASAAQAIAAASAQLQLRMDDMRANKEGWMAYALEGELDTGNTQR